MSNHTLDEEAFFDSDVPNGVKALIYQMMGGNIPLSRMSEQGKLILCDDEAHSMHWFDLPDDESKWKQAACNSLLFSLNQNANVTARIVLEPFNLEGQDVLALFAKEESKNIYHVFLIGLEAALAVDDEGVPEMVLVPTRISVHQEPQASLKRSDFCEDMNKRLGTIETALNTDIFQLEGVPEA